MTHVIDFTVLMPVCPDLLLLLLLLIFFIVVNTLRFLDHLLLTWNQSVNCTTNKTVNLLQKIKYSGDHF